MKEISYELINEREDGQVEIGGDMNTNSFLDYYKKVKERINKEIENFNQDFLVEENELIKYNKELFANLNSDGKRIRGVLVNLGYNLLKDDFEYPNKLALAYEVFQTAILVHDDIIDNDNKRRGKDTIHFANNNKYNDRHLASSIALCMGDYGLYEANKIIAVNYSDNPNYRRVLENFMNTVIVTIRGEIIDTILPYYGKNRLLDPKKIEESILEIFRLKTSHYTIIGPLSVGAILAGADENKIKDIEKFGEQVGIAFQIQDDTLGIFSEEMVSVKGSDISDIKEFKQTILYSHVISTKYKEEFLSLYGKDNLTKEQISRVQEILKESGSLEYATNMMNQRYDKSLEILDKINWLSSDKKDLLRGFVEYLRNRNK